MPIKFGGGGEPCRLCGKTVYPAELVRTTTNYAFHKACFRCTKCNCQLQPSSAFEDAGTGRQYCKPHYTAMAFAAGADGRAKGGLDKGATALKAKDKKVEREEAAELLHEGVTVWVEMGAKTTQLFSTKAKAARELFVRAELVSASPTAEEDWYEVRSGGATCKAPRRMVARADETGVQANNLLLLHLNEPSLLHNLRGAPLSPLEQQRLRCVSAEHQPALH